MRTLFKRKPVKTLASVLSCFTKMVKEIDELDAHLDAELDSKIAKVEELENESNKVAVEIEDIFDKRQEAAAVRKQLSVLLSGSVS